MYCSRIHYCLSAGSYSANSSLTEWIQIKLVAEDSVDVIFTLYQQIRRDVAVTQPK